MSYEKKYVVKKRRIRNIIVVTVLIITTAISTVFTFKYLDNKIAEKSTNYNRRKIKCFRCRK